MTTIWKLLAVASCFAFSWPLIGFGKEPSDQRAPREFEVRVNEPKQFDLANGDLLIVEVSAAEQVIVSKKRSNMNMGEKSVLLTRGKFEIGQTIAFAVGAYTYKLVPKVKGREYHFALSSHLLPTGASAFVPDPSGPQNPAVPFAPYQPDSPRSGAAR